MYLPVPDVLLGKQGLAEKFKFTDSKKKKKLYFQTVCEYLHGPYNSLLDILHIKRGCWAVKISHFFREENRVADW